MGQEGWPRGVTTEVNAKVSKFKEATKNKEAFLEYIRTEDGGQSGNWSWVNEGKQVSRPLLQI